MIIRNKLKFVILRKSKNREVRRLFKSLHLIKEQQKILLHRNYFDLGIYRLMQDSCLKELSVSDFISAKSNLILRKKY